MNTQKIFKLAELFKKFAVVPPGEEFEEIPRTQPEGIAEEDAPETERPEDFTYPELEGPSTERGAPHADLARPDAGVPVNITMNSSLLVSGLRFLLHSINREEARMKSNLAQRRGEEVELSSHQQEHINKLKGFYNQLEAALQG